MQTQPLSLVSHRFSTPWKQSMSEPWDCVWWVDDAQGRSLNFFSLSLG
jgi:hypothetical protein